MKYKYIYIILLVILFLIPMFFHGEKLSFIFHTAYFIACAIFAFLAWKQKKRTELLLFVLFFILNIIQLFDKEDKYFYIQIILLVSFVLITFIEWRKRNKEGGID